MAFFGLALICYEQNDLQMALRYIRQTIELCQHWGHIGILMGGYVMLFRIKQALGEIDSAWQALNEAERLARAYSQVPRATSWVEAFRVRSWLAHGDRDAAIRWAQQSGLKLDDDIPYLREAEYLTLGRVLHEQGEHDQAEALLEHLRHSIETAGRMGSLLELLVLQALVLQSRGESLAGLESLRKALSLAAPEGYVRVFLDEGAPLAKLLRQAGSRGIEPRYVSGLLAEFDRMSGSQALSQQPLIEPLSEREIEILKLIAAGKSNREIAAQLVLSTGTVKSHLSHIFGKLSVDSRTQCIARARDLKILQE
jgi:LuxR family maltose regulon positive regulatory protein